MRMQTKASCFLEYSDGYRSACCSPAPAGSSMEAAAGSSGNDSAATSELNGGEREKEQSLRISNFQLNSLRIGENQNAAKQNLRCG